jgi:DHA1 family inner membrane transport protein
VAYLRNTTVNLLNLHYAVHAFAFGAGGVFFGVFLLRAGVPAPLVLVALTFILAGRFALRPLILPLAKRFGLRPLVMTGAILIGAQYPILAEVRGVDLALLALCAVAAIGDTFYWTCYHAYFAALGDHQHRGHQISAREALASVIGIAAPLIGGWALSTIGPRAAFGAVAVVQMLSALPLIGAPNIAVAAKAEGAFRAAFGGIALFAADGWMSGGVVMTWQIALFITLGNSFTAFGGAMALAALVGAVGGLLLGRAIDSGAGPRAALVALGAAAITIALRAASLGHPALAVLANALGAFAGLLYAPTFLTPIYNLAKGSPCPLRFHIATEGAFDLGAGSFMLLAAAILSLGGGFSIVMLIPLAGAAAVYALLRRYYGAAARTAAMEA